MTQPVKHQECHRKSPLWLASANTTIHADLTALTLNVFPAEPTSKESEVEDLFEHEEMARDWAGAGLEVGGLGDSAVSPLGRTPSANHTLLCSRESDPKPESHKNYFLSEHLSLAYRDMKAKNHSQKRKKEKRNGDRKR